MEFSLETGEGNAQICAAKIKRTVCKPQNPKNSALMARETVFCGFYSGRTQGPQGKRKRASESTLPKALSSRRNSSQFFNLARELDGLIIFRHVFWIQAWVGYSDLWVLRRGIVICR